MHAVVVAEDAMRRSFEIVELAASCRPPETRTDQKREHDRQRDQEKENVHFRCRRCIAVSEASAASRHAFPTTTSEETDMPTAAASGDRWPLAASGMASAL